MTSLLHRPRALDHPHGPAADAVPPATRHSRPGWRDPRILLGLVILTGSVLLGVTVLRGADDTVGVWAARHDIPAGTTVTAGDLQRVQVRFADAARAERYLSADRALAAGAVLDREIGADEMIPRAALTSAREALVEVPLAVAVDDLPATVRQGSRVDVWVTPQGVAASAGAGADQLADATRVLEGVVVVQVPKAVDSFAPTGTQQVVVGVARDEADDLGAALGQTAQGRVVITRQG